MLWCPNCKAEYRAGFTICADCGLPLEKKPHAENDIQHEGAIIKLVYLVSAKNEYNAAIVESLLHSYGIPTMRKYLDLNLYWKSIGFANNEVELYVPENAYAAAMEILENKKAE